MKESSRVCHPSFSAFSVAALVLISLSAIISKRRVTNDFLQPVDSDHINLVIVRWNTGAKVKPRGDTALPGDWDDRSRLKIIPQFTLPPKSKIPVTPFDKAIEVSASKYRLDPLLLKAIIAVESEFNEHCVSPAGAAGLMQLMPTTAQILAVNDIFDPQENIHGGARHFRYLLDTFANDLPKSLAAYNAGEIPVIRYKGIPPYPETQRYVRRVLEIYDSYRS